jgi:hypothetical protein
MESVRSGVTDRVSSLTRDGPELSREAVFDVLRNKRRRYALHHLKQQDGPVSTGALAEQVAAWEYGTTVSELSSRERQRVYVSLVQTHLPKMIEEGVVTVDEDSREVALTEEAAEFDVYLEIVSEEDIDWAQYYLGVTALNAGILVVASLNLPLLSRAPDVLWVLAVAMVFLFAALVHNWYHRKSRIGIEGEPPN